MEGSGSVGEPSILDAGRVWCPCLCSCPVLSPDPPAPRAVRDRRPAFPTVHIDRPTTPAPLLQRLPLRSDVQGPLDALGRALGDDPDADLLDVSEVGTVPTRARSGPAATARRTVRCVGRCTSAPRVPLVGKGQLDFA